MSQRIFIKSAAFAAFFCLSVLVGGPTAGAADLSVSPNDFGLEPAGPIPPLPAAQVDISAYNEVPAVGPSATAQALAAPVSAPGTGEGTGAFLPGAPVVYAAPAPAFVPAPVAVSAPLPAQGVLPVTGYTDATLQTVAPDLYASLTATVTATTGDPSIPVVVRPASTAQAMDASGVPVDLAGLAAQGSPVVDWNAAKAGTPYPVETPGQPGVTTYVVPIQVPVYVQPGMDAVTAATARAQTLPVQPVPAQQIPQAAPFVNFIQPGQPVAQSPVVTDPFAHIIAVTPGAPRVLPTATAGTGTAGAGGVFYYGQNPVSIASALGMETADGAEYLDFAATPDGAINLVTTAQIKQAVQRGVPLVIIDVRGELVREIEGRVPGDVGVPFEPRDSFPARAAQAAPDKSVPVVVYCQDGVWSSQAADVLLGMGYKTFLMGSYRLW